jgi:hypothetical protein
MFYVYGHFDSNGVIQYVGKGSKNRANRFGSRSKRWNEVFKGQNPGVRIFCEVESEDEAFLIESKIIKESIEAGYDLINVYEGGKKNFSESERTKKILSEMRSGENCYWYGKKRGAEYMKKLKQAQEIKCPKPRLGAKLTEEHKAKLLEKTHLPETIEKRRKKMIGRKLTDEHKSKIGRKGELHHFFGKTFSEEHRKKLSESHMGVARGEMPDYHRNKISEGRLKSEKVKASGLKIREARKKNGTDKGYFTSKAKEVLCIETNERYRSAKEAAVAVAGSDKNIQACCTGKKKSHKGFTWRYSDVSP